jgi:hypothetical protein
MSMRGSVAKSGVNLRRRTIRRRVIALGVAGVTIAGAQIGVSMLGDTGTVAAAVDSSTATSRHIFASTFPGTVTTWAAGQANTNGTSGGVATPARVKWTAAPSATGSVTTAGDVAIIDATTASLPAGSTGVAVTMYISNLANFSKNYSSFALPVGIYTFGTPGGGAWTQLTPTGSPLGGNFDFYSTAAFPAQNALFISDTDGSVTVNLPAGHYYEILIDKGGFWQSTAAVTSTSTDLGPSFYLTSTVY